MGNHQGSVLSPLLFVIVISREFRVALPWELLSAESCQKWVHKKCSGIKGSVSKVAKSFICRGCLNPVTSAGRTSVDIGASAKLELVDKFCYLCAVVKVVMCSRGGLSL